LKFAKVLAKNKFAQFFETRCIVAPVRILMPGVGTALDGFSFVVAEVLSTMSDICVVDGLVVVFLTTKKCANE